MASTGMTEGQTMTMQDRRGRDRGPKGRGLDDAALEDVRALLGERPRRRDLLIEHLHLIQDRYGHLSAAHLRALAEEMRLSQAEVYEVASFYDHFDIVNEGETPPPALTIRVCDSVSCMLAGAEKLIGELGSAVDPKAVRVVRAPCMGRCAGAPAARIGDREVDHATAEKLQEMARDGQTDVVVPEHVELAAYLADGGYETLRKVRSGEIGLDAIIEKMQGAGLRGLGGAGFPTGRKWGFVRAYPGPRLMAVNGDEGEPGTFKDRIYLESRPAPLLRGRADRRPGGRGGTHLHLHARRISGGAGDPAQGDRGARGRRPRRRPASSSCGAVPAPISAAKRAR